MAKISLDTIVDDCGTSINILDDASPPAGITRGKRLECLSARRLGLIGMGISSLVEITVVARESVEVVKHRHLHHVPRKKPSLTRQSK